MEPRRTQRTTFFEEELRRRMAENRLRSTVGLPTELDLSGPEEARLLDFCSNDYLGLARDPDVVHAATAAAQRYGAGATASRLIAGNLPLHESLEAELARHVGREAALLFASGFQANVSVLPALSHRKGLILCDRSSHHSILQGALGSRAKVLRFRHNDPEHLTFLLREHAPGRRTPPPLIVTESIFSMDGDRAPLEEICQVADRHDALLMVDDAHAFGVWGPAGAGLAAAHERIDLILGTFGKALGGFGAFVACSATLRSYLVNFCGGFIYTTAPPPASIGAAGAALEKVASGALGQKRFRERVAEAHDALRKAGFDTAPSDTQIVPIRMNDEEEALACASFLRREGILTVAIRPPTVPAGSSRIRVTLNRLHTRDDVARLVDGLGRHRRAREGASRGVREA